MKNSFIALILLVFELSGSFAYSPTDGVIKGHTDSDVYAVQEDPNTKSIKFVNPPSDRPTLREIVYYHVIEKAYGEDMAETESITERPFTNAHGLPFYEEGGNEVLRNHTTYETDVQTDNFTVTAPDVESKKGDDKEIAVEIDKQIAVEITTELPDALNEPARKSKALLFDEIKNKYRAKYDEDTKDDVTDHSRRKRDARAQEIPEAPAIPRIKYEAFPAYLRQLISTEGPNLVSQRDETETNDENDEKLKETEKVNTKFVKSMEERMKELGDSLRSFEENDRQLVKEREENELSRTYGMKLDSEGGYVWNDIFTDPGISYDVGNSEKHQENDFDNMKEPSQQIPDDVDMEEDDISTADKNTNKEDELDDIYVHILKNKINKPSIEEKDESVSTDKETTKESNKQQSTAAEDLLESDEFWSWVATWTEMVVDIMKKITKKTIEEEVKKQLKTIPETIQEDNNDGMPLVSQKDAAESADIDEVSGNANKFEIKGNKLIIDGTEIPLTDVFHVDDEDEEKSKNKNQLKRRKNNNKKPSSSDENDKNNEYRNNETRRKNQSEFNVEIKNVYGNTIGSDKVTNVFIFNPDKGLDKIIQELKSLAGDDGVLIIQHDDEKVQDENDEKEDVPVQKEKEESKVEQNKEATVDKEEETKEEDNKEETVDEEEETKVEEKEINSKPESSEPTKPEEPVDSEEHQSNKLSESEKEISKESETNEDDSKDNDDKESESPSQSATDTPSEQDQESDDEKKGETDKLDDKETDLDKAKKL